MLFGKIKTGTSLISLCGARKRRESSGNVGDAEIEIDSDVTEVACHCGREADAPVGKSRAELPV